MEDKKNEEYTDKQLKDATQVAYLNFLEPAIKNRMADGKEGPFSIKSLMEDYINQDLLYKNLNEAKKELEDLEKKAEHLKYKSIITNKQVTAARQKVFLEESKIKNMPMEALLAGYTDISESDREILCNLSNESLDWKIVDIHNRNEENGFYGCVIETDDKKAIVGIRGSEGLNNYSGLVNDWKNADFGLFNSKYTEQQKEIERFIDMLSVNGILNKYNSLAVTGHSLGGNLATHFGIVASNGEHRKEIFNKLNQIVSFDGPGFSKEYIKYHKEAIKNAAHKIKHYKWSLVGCLLNDIPGESIDFLKVDDKYLDDMNFKSLNRHSTRSIMFSKTGKAIKGEQDDLSKFTHSISVKAEYVPIKKIIDYVVPSKILHLGGLAITAIKKAITKGFKKDIYQADDGLMSGSIYNYFSNHLKKSGHKDVENAAKKDQNYNGKNVANETKNMRDYYEGYISSVLGDDSKNRE